MSVRYVVGEDVKRGDMVEVGDDGLLWRYKRFGTIVVADIPVLRMICPECKNMTAALYDLEEAPGKHYHGLVQCFNKECGFLLIAIFKGKGYLQLEKEEGE